MIEDAAQLPFHIHAQPDDQTCGPTCLHSVYRYYGESVSLESVIDTMKMLGVEAGRGTLAPWLGLHALMRGYRARLITFNLHMFDPTWFPADGSKPGDPQLISNKLRQQAAALEKVELKYELATQAYLEFLEAGGEIFMQDVSAQLIHSFLRKGLPILTGLSSTYLYRAPREVPPLDDEDDVRGVPGGHFVVVCGYDGGTRKVQIADPLENNPAFASRRYEVDMPRLLGSIYLGVLTYDANLLVIEPKTLGALPSLEKSGMKGKKSGNMP